LKKTFTRPKKTRKDDDLKKTNAEENARSNRKNQCRFRPAATSDTPFLVAAQNGYEGSLSPQAFGIVACLYAYSHLSFTPKLADVCGEQFHRLREVAMDHTEARGILAAID
jgi:hypothetical protein